MVPDISDDKVMGTLLCITLFATWKIIYICRDLFNTVFFVNINFYSNILLFTRTNGFTKNKKHSLKMYFRIRHVYFFLGI
jgi:hypothetical protein